MKKGNNIMIRMFSFFGFRKNPREPTYKRISLRMRFFECKRRNYITYLTY